MKLCIIGDRGHVWYVFEKPEVLKGIEISAVSPGCGDSPENLLKMCAETGRKPRLYEDWLEMLDREKPDAACISGPFEKHAEMCVESLNRGIHVFCEKPVAFDSAGLERIRQAYLAGHAKLLSMTALRYDPAFRFAHSLAVDGAVGEITLIQTRKSYKLGTRPEYYKHRSSYGGTIGWVGSHALDWILWFSGSRFQTACAFQTAIHNGGNGEMESAAQCIFRMENGILAQASLDYFRPEGAPTWGDDRIRIVGTGGIVEVACGKVILTDSSGMRELAVPPESGIIFADFLREIEGKGSSLIPAEDVFELTRGCIMAQRSADNGGIPEERSHEI